MTPNAPLSEVVAGMEKSMRRPFEAGRWVLFFRDPDDFDLPPGHEKREYYEAESDSFLGVYEKLSEVWYEKTKGIDFRPMLSRFYFDIPPDQKVIRVTAMVNRPFSYGPEVIAVIRLNP